MAKTASLHDFYVGLAYLVVTYAPTCDQLPPSNNKPCSLLNCCESSFYIHQTVTHLWTEVSIKRSNFKMISFEGYILKGYDELMELIFSQYLYVSLRSFPYPLLLQWSILLFLNYKSKIWMEVLIFYNLAFTLINWKD